MTAKESLVEKIRQIIMSKEKNIDDVSLEINEYNTFGKYNPDLIFQTACDAVELSAQSLKPSDNPKRGAQSNVLVRQIFSKHMRDVSGLHVRFSRIGKYLNRNHSSIVQSVKKINAMLDVKDKKVTLAYNRFKTLIEVRKHLI